MKVFVLGSSSPTRMIYYEETTVAPLQVLFLHDSNTFSQRVLIPVSMLIRAFYRQASHADFFKDSSSPHDMAIAVG